VIIRVAADDDDVPALSLVEPLGQASFVVYEPACLLRHSREPQVMLDNFRCPSSSSLSIPRHMLLSQDRDTAFLLDVT
jgi:hypothetical protein